MTLLEFYLTYDVVLGTKICATVTQTTSNTITVGSDVTLVTYAQQHHLHLPLPIPMQVEMITLYICQGHKLRIMADPWFKEGKCELYPVDGHFVCSFYYSPLAV